MHPYVTWLYMFVDAEQIVSYLLISQIAFKVSLVVIV